MDKFSVEFHHATNFVDHAMVTYVSEVATWECDADRWSWSYFEIVKIVKDTSYLR